jgi:hypothetical protein
MIFELVKYGRVQNCLYNYCFYVNITKLTAQNLVMKYVGSEAWGGGGACLVLIQLTKRSCQQRICYVAQNIIAKKNTSSAQGYFSTFQHTFVTTRYRKFLFSSIDY